MERDERAGWEIKLRLKYELGKVVSTEDEGEHKMFNDIIVILILSLFEQATLSYSNLKIRSINCHFSVLEAFIAHP